MTNEEKIAALEAEIKELKTQVHNLGTALMLHGDSTTKWFKKAFGDIGKAFRDITEIEDLLMPTLHTLFPGIKRTNKEIHRVLRRRRPPSGKSTS
jgi:hypothetical protein